MRTVILRNVPITSDGQGGAWVHCKTNQSEGHASKWKLWHAAQNGTERDLFEYPASSKLTCDGQGSAFVLCSTSLRRETSE